MNNFLEAAIGEARKSLKSRKKGIPIGAVLVYRNKIIGSGHNQRVQKGNPILHAEMDALQNAGRQAASVYRECTMVTTLSPCIMCSGAALLYKIPRVIIGENHTFVGAERLLASHGVAIEIVQNEECIAMMTEFIRRYPELWYEDIGVKAGEVGKRQIRRHAGHANRSREGLGKRSRA